MKVEFSLLQLPLQHPKPWTRFCLILLTGLCILQSGHGWALEPQPQAQLEHEEFFRPLVDTSRQKELGEIRLEPLEGRAHRQGEIPVNETSSQSRIITGQVKTLQEAIDSEKDVVDWYGWYLAARGYISQSGGLRCPLGTPIKFYRNGKIEALTFDSACMASVIGRRFPLPPNTQLDALILPVRPGQGPPATRDEIYSRIRTNQN